MVQKDRDGPVAILTLNRPEVLNTLSPEMLSALCAHLETCGQDSQVWVIVISGSGRASAAGADIRAMAKLIPSELLRLDTRAYWLRIRQANKSLIAAVIGCARGRGYELAMTSDLIVASETALFGQPVIKLGIIPGEGGTQRLASAVGPYRAMESVLTGEPVSAAEALSAGVVNRVVLEERTLPEAPERPHLIAARPPVAVRLAQEDVRMEVETTPQQGLEIERRIFLLLFDTQDRKEGMRAFLEKCLPELTGE